MKLPIFPLPIFLLPQGITRLRIFEQRYLKMVKQAVNSDGFAILLNENSQYSTVDWASWVEIINFDQDENGMLIIDVKCKSLVQVSDLYTDEDKLHHATVKVLPHWVSDKHDDVTRQLSLSLQKVFNQNLALRELYPTGFIDEASWVVARWLELLPVKLPAKSFFSAADSFEAAKQFVANIVLRK